MKIIFAGTPDFAAVALEELIKAGHDIAYVLTQPDRPSGRGMKLTPTPVKCVAQEHQIEVLTPETLSFKRDPENSQAILEKLTAAEADVFIVAAYGLILPSAFLTFAKGIGQNHDIHAINIHASLLPRWRGAAPIARAIQSQDPTTGVTLMRMEAGLDTGPMILKEEVAIKPTDTHASLTDDLAHLGAKLLVRGLNQADTLTYEVQPEEGVTYANKLLKDEAPIDWSQPASTLAARIQAFNPFPGSTFVFKDETYKVWQARCVNAPDVSSKTPGEVLCAQGKLWVQCGEGVLEILEIQKPGRRRMETASFLQSSPFTNGDLLS